MFINNFCLTKFFNNMKKVFLFLATAALFASCADDLLEPNNGFQASNEKGITFQVVDDAATRGLMEEVGGAYKSYFFAEQDRIDVWSNNAVYDFSSGLTAWTDAPVTYKATSSTGNPRFTGASDLDILDFRPWNTTPAAGGPVASFLAAYPQGQSVTRNNDGSFTIIPNVDLQTQNMDGHMNFDARLLYDFATGKKNDGSVKETNISVGERVNLEFKSPLSMAILKIADVNDYKSYFGSLSEVTFATNANEPLIPALAGQQIVVEEQDLVKVGGVTYLKSTCTPVCKDWAHGGNAVEIPVGSGNWYTKASCKQVDGVYVLTQTSVQVNPTAPDPATFDHWDVTGATQAHLGDVIASINHTDEFVYKADETMEYKDKSIGTNESIVKKAKLAISNFDIKNDVPMNIYVLPTSGHDDNNKVNYTISYKFANVDLTYDYPTGANFKANGGLEFKALNISDQFKYIVTKKGTNPGRTLIVNSGDLESIFNSANKVKWTDSEAPNGEVNPTEITTIKINENVENFDANDWTRLNQFTSATSLTINSKNITVLKSVTGLTSLTELIANKVTEVSANAFNSGVAGSLKKLELKSVTKFGVQSTNFTALTDLNLASYKFLEITEVSPEKFFNATTQGTLANVDLSSVESLAPVFGYERNILFTGYTALKTIALWNGGTKISANEFKGCTLLNKVTGVVEFSTAESAFEGCANLGTVNIAGREIPKRAFYGSGVKTVNYENALVIPVFIGESAFQNDTQIDKLSLKEATTIEKNAFNGATSFKGIGKNDVVTLIVTEVAENAFLNTAVVRFQLLNAKKTNSGSLASNALKQIKYRQTGLTINANQVQTPANVDIFVKVASDASKFPGYRTVTKEDFDWED